jgi:thioredoxin 1
LKEKQKTLIVGIFIVVVGLILIQCSPDQSNRKSDQKTSGEVSNAGPESDQTKKLPMLIDLGKGTCVPCKKMKPILEELEKEYQGKAIVKVIDLRYEPKEADKYKIRLIPTQIFFNGEGKEIYRHEGFLDKQAIKAKFAEIGVY